MVISDMERHVELIDTYEVDLEERLHWMYGEWQKSLQEIEKERKDGILARELEEEYQSYHRGERGDYTKNQELFERIMQFFNNPYSQYVKNKQSLLGKGPALSLLE